MSGGKRWMEFLSISNDARDNFSFSRTKRKVWKMFFFQAFNIYIGRKTDICYWQCLEYPQYDYLKFKCTQNSQILLFWVDSYKTLERKTDVSLVEYLKLPILQNVPQKMLFVLKWRRNWQLLSPSFSVCRYWSLPARRRRSHYWPTFGPVGGGGSSGGEKGRQIRQQQLLRGGRLRAADDAAAGQKAAEFFFWAK